MMIVGREEDENGEVGLRAGSPDPSWLPTPEAYLRQVAKECALQATSLFSDNLNFTLKPTFS